MVIPSYGTSNYPTLAVWDEDFNVVHRSYYYANNSTVGLFGFIPAVFGDSGNIFASGSSTNTNYNTPLLRWDTNYNLTLAYAGYYSTTSYAFALERDNTGIYIGQSISTDGKGILTKVNTTGTTILWSKEITNSSNRGYRINRVRSKNGYVFTAGRAQQSSSTFYSAGLGLWNTSGNLLWFNRSNSSQYADWIDVDTDASNNIYVVGWLNYIGHVVKSTLGGAFQWSLRTPTQYEYLYGVVVDQDTGDFYVSGSTYTTGGRVAIAVYKYDSDGYLIWQRRISMWTTSNNTYSYNHNWTRLVLQPDGMLRVVSQGNCTIHGNPMYNIIVLDPDDPPMGSWTDTGNSTGAYGIAGYRWDIDDVIPQGDLIRLTTNVWYDDTTNTNVSNAGDTLQDMSSAITPSAITGTDWFEQYATTTFT
jgi:hypothetical protein